MNKRKSKKEIITEAILAEIPKSNRQYHEAKLSDLIYRWWFSGKYQDGLRLTDEGVAAFALADIEFYDYDFKHPNKSYHNFLLELNKKIKCPYYLGSNKVDKTKPGLYIRLYDSKIAMMLNLYGDLTEYCDSIKISGN